MNNPIEKIAESLGWMKAERNGVEVWYDLPRALKDKRQLEREVETLRTRARDYEQSERRSTMFIASLVKKSGGWVEIDDIEEMIAFDLVVFRDESKRVTVLKVRPKE